jgi:hypothetical protein
MMIMQVEKIESKSIRLMFLRFFVALKEKD